MAKHHTSTKKLHIAREWTFRSREVAEKFDAHVREQLPWYDLATGLVAHVARHYLPRGGTVIDVGASTGNMGRALAPTLTARSARLIPVDAALEMRAVYRGPGDLVIADATEYDFAAVAPDVVIMFLVAMFVPVEKRAALLRAATRAIRPGGALILFDKMEPRPGYVGVVCSRLALAAKHEAGASAEEVIAKELSLAGVQRPLKDADLLAGFVEVFRFGDFAGYVCEC